MNKKVYYVIGILLAICLGAGGMYLYKYYNPTKVTETINKLEKSVTVNDNGISDGIENIYDAVVVVENYRNGQLAGIGSGFIYNEDGFIMTNNHVISGANEVRVLLSSKAEVNAKVIGGDKYADIAIIQIDKNVVSQVAKMGSSEKSKLGDTVFTIGTPVGTEYAGTVTRGILSGKDRLVEVSVNSNSNDWIMNVMQTDAAINPGNSGGPLCNVSGEVIGINSMKLVEDSIENIGFSIPIEDALIYANKIISGEETKRAYLGVSMADINTNKRLLLNNGIEIDSSITSGVIVYDLDMDSPAAKAGIEKGDVIVKIGEYTIENVAQLRYYLYKYNPKEKVAIEVIREKAKTTYNVTLGMVNQE